MTTSWVRLLSRPAEEVAPRLLGTVLVSELGGSRVAVRLVEVEAYAGTGQDPGSHSHRGRTARNATMFGRPGLAYVYFTYGMHFCLNVVVRPEGTSSGVLLRAGQVVEGVEAARSRRPGATDRDLARGPARLTRALAVTRDLDGADLLDRSGPLHLRAEPPVRAAAVRSGPRVGVAGAGAATPWRFWLDGDPAVSTYRPAVPRGGRTRRSGTLEPTTPRDRSVL